MMTTRVLEQIFFVLSVSVCFCSYSGGDNPRSTDMMVITTSSEAAKENRHTATRTRLEKTSYACLLYDVGASRQTSRVRQGQEQCFVTLKPTCSFILKRWL